MGNITVDEKYFEALREKALLYDKMIDARRRGAAAINRIAPAERKKRAQIAAAARWHKK